jgi:hypothetical protein
MRIDRRALFFESSGNPREWRMARIRFVSLTQLLEARLHRKIHELTDIPAG